MFCCSLPFAPCAVLFDNLVRLLKFELNLKPETRNQLEPPPGTERAFGPLKQPGAEDAEDAECNRATKHLLDQK